MKNVYEIFLNFKYCFICQVPFKKSIFVQIYRFNGNERKKGAKNYVKDSNRNRVNETISS